jgi:hypothetical protein
MRDCSNVPGAASPTTCEEGDCVIEDVATDHVDNLLGKADGSGCTFWGGLRSWTLSPEDNSQNPRQDSSSERIYHYSGGTLMFILGKRE